MKGQAVSAEAHVALLHRVFQKRLHLAELGFGGFATHAGLEAHHLYPQHRMGDKGGNVRAQRHAVKVVHVVTRVIPGDLLGDFAQYGLGNVLNPGKAIHDRLLLARLLGAKAGAQAAVAHEYRRRAMAHHFGERGLYVDF